ncbi:hypothetical protein SLV14_003576 [Streptomyces sp. Je 1-4]|uniref:hypothetical protein n=1 Tax=Streptomyces TaxID=1883 RepID=UPI0021D9B2DA|nr:MULTISPECIES: hypothetical protein [unclassified Streptomyces]UYB40899.1 hypothetical protein SLV14_003576 [Streptomyces sp. Je 1-4]UZQ37058.1 hypothetical protein SLV14N_003576 [Streptomyces sp. Je 1-4] [Streptomyces sp. Je 1-4 4N24]UZQ44475.1 hypothetical protein SLV14NA_003576 [Streptomyces sp. Je 1-4] [Streptomyces sp. Je 1-4 4N24_ara]
MPPSAPSWTSVHRSERLADTPAVRRGGHWWLVSPAGTMLTSDQAFAAELDRFADDMAAANRAVAELHVEDKAARNPVRKARR